MLEQIEALRKEIESFQVSSEEELETYRRKFTNRKGIVNEIFTQFRGLPSEEKRSLGKPLNELKQLSQEIKSQRRGENLTAQTSVRNFNKPKPHSTPKQFICEAPMLIRQGNASKYSDYARYTSCFNHSN